MDEETMARILGANRFGGFTNPEDANALILGQAPTALRGRRLRKRLEDWFNPPEQVEERGFKPVSIAQFSAIEKGIDKSRKLRRLMKTRLRLRAKIRKTTRKREHAQLVTKRRKLNSRIRKARTGYPTSTTTAMEQSIRHEDATRKAAQNAARKARRANKQRAKKRAGKRRKR